MNWKRDRRKSPFAVPQRARACRSRPQGPRRPRFSFSDAIVKQRWSGQTNPGRRKDQRKTPDQGRRRHTRQTLPGHVLQSEPRKCRNPRAALSSAAVDDPDIGHPSGPRQPCSSQNRQKPDPTPPLPPGPPPRPASAEGITGLPPAPPSSPHPPCRAPSPAQREKGKARGGDRLPHSGRREGRGMLGRRPTREGKRRRGPSWTTSRSSTTRWCSTS